MSDLSKTGKLLARIEAYQTGIEEYEKKVKMLEALVYVPGLFRCAKCKFQLNKIAIHVHTGAMSADNSPDSCPNCSSPLWRVTERDAGNDLCDRLEAMHTKLTDVTTERDQLKKIWEASSDYVLALRHEEFANCNGGVEVLRSLLQRSIDAYELGEELPTSGLKELREEAAKLGITITEENEVDKTRITYDMLDELIVEEYYFTAADAVASQEGRGQPPLVIHPSLMLHTFCVLVMKSGTTITGESCCATPENFDAERGRAAAKSRAMTKAFELEGYKLAAERKAKADSMQELAKPTGQ